MQEQELDIAQALGQRLRKVRLKLNLSQTELASELGFPTRSLQDYEAGKSLPHTKRRRRILTFLKANEQTEEAA